MDEQTRNFILRLLDHGKDLTIATIRPDGYPQATTVSYANDGLNIYIGTGKDSQKVKNIQSCNKVSLTVNNDYKDWDHIQGLSMGADAEILTAPEEVQHAIACIVKRFPEIAKWASENDVGNVVFLKIKPRVISVLDYEKGFGHTDLVPV